MYIPVVRCAMDSVVSDLAHDDTSPSTDEPNYENYNTKNNNKLRKTSVNCNTHTRTISRYSKKEKKKVEKHFYFLRCPVCSSHQRQWRIILRASWYGVISGKNKPTKFLIENSYFPDLCRQVEGHRPCLQLRWSVYERNSFVWCVAQTLSRDHMTIMWSVSDPSLHII